MLSLGLSLLPGQEVLGIKEETRPHVVVRTLNQEPEGQARILSLNRRVTTLPLLVLNFSICHMRKRGLLHPCTLYKNSVTISCIFSQSVSVSG